jgi:hypothetical protein
MDKTQLRKILKPLIKECIKEVIFEDGTLSTVISEVVKGLGNPLTESRPSLNHDYNKQIVETDDQAQARRAKLQESRKKMMDAIGKDAYNGVNVFENITPAPDSQNTNYGALKDTNPRDPGVDISSLMGGAGIWKKLAGK